MFKRLLIILLAVCLITGGASFPLLNAAVYAEELPDNMSGMMQAISSGEDLTEGQTVASEVYLPIHPPQVHMTAAKPPQSNQRLQAAKALPLPTNEVLRYSVLVLDTSASSSFVDSKGRVFYTADTAIDYVKTSAKKFIEATQVADGTNYVAIVSYKGSQASVVSPFSTDVKALGTAIDSIYASSNNRNVAAGLQAADKLISEISEPSAVKNVVLVTTGMTNDGKSNYNGHYDESTVGSKWRRMDTEIRLYAYANVAYEAAEALKQKATLNTIGLFQTFEGMPEEGKEVAQFFKLSALDWATSPQHFYDVKDPNDLEFVFGEVANSIVKKTGTFKYLGDGRDYSATYYYEDSYFYNSAYLYNEHLATMSLNLELSAWASADAGDSYENKSNNAYNLLTDIGFTDFESNDWFKAKPTKDSIGAVAARKKITEDGKDYTLVALAVRGGGYESEWASNFTIGESGQHQGFSEARDQVLTFLQEYISDKEIQGDIKLWITGFSRGAATANMVAGKIDEGGVSFPGTTLALHDMYAYTFETPAGAQLSDMKSDVYGNIFNIINPSDLVPKVAPAVWSFTRYGIDKWLPSAETDSENSYSESLSRMLARYNALEEAAPYVVDDFLMKRIHIDGWKILPGGDPFISIIDDTKNAQSQNAFLNAYITMLTKDFLKSRSNFVGKFQNGIRDICGLFFGASSSQSEKLIAAATEKFSSKWGWLAYEMLKPNLNPWGSNEKDAYEKVAQYLKESLDEAGITAYSQTEFDNAVVTLLDLVAAVLTNHPNLATTMVKNIGGIGQAHHPELALAWMQSMDSYYTPGGAVGFSSGKYRIVRINCPVDVQVFNDDNQLVASIIDDVPQEVSTIISALNEDGEKLVFLPASEKYTVVITATGDDRMTYSINEYSPEAGEVNRLINYNDVPIVTGQELSGVVPAYNPSSLNNITEEASDTVYRLETKGTEITSSADLSGKEATSAYFTINASANDETLGLVQGSGTRQLGTFAQVEATAYADSEFLGWYKDDKVLVSKEAAYRFRVDSDSNITARFVSTVSNDANLAMLSLGKDIAFTPAFSPEHTSYTASVGNGISSVTVTAASSDPDATISGIGLKSLSVGENTINVAVTAKDNKSKKTYTITVTRAEASGGGGGGYNPPAPQLSMSMESTSLSLQDAKDTIKLGEIYSFTPVLNSGPSKLSKALKLTVDGAAVPDAKSGEVYTLSNLAAGTHTIVISYPGEGNYNATSLTKSVIVVQGDSLIKSEEPAFVNVFTDVAEGAWYYEHIMWAVKNGIVSGAGNGKYAAAKPVTRAEFVAMLARYYKADVESYGEVSFTDVSESAWYSKYIGWAAANGIVTGYGNGRFGANDNLSREQVAVILYNIHAKPPVTGLSLAYTDKKEISAWAVDAVAYWSNAGVLKGKENQLFDPKGSITRAESATVLHELENHHHQ
ncbi:S-layer homology domain-containing protein [Paenibacillus sp. FSL H8-0048]|uniref:S-layer homology domain-containing protein n=1 Tax=Paenibacillus sp. FSL H8-0048 TaxID=2954508 RepID=UPI0030FB36E1